MVPERERAFQVIEWLNAHRLLPPGWRFEGTGWDRSHHSKPARLTPQQAIDGGIDHPGDCDIAVFIFWKRIGTPLVPDSFEPNGAGPDPTGSSWELHNALESPGTPRVLVYHCDREPAPGPGDYADIEAYARQLKGLQDFLSGFKDPQGRWLGSYCTFSDLDGFAQHLEQDLSQYLTAQIAPGDAAGPAREI